MSYSVLACQISTYHSVRDNPEPGRGVQYNYLWDDVPRARELIVRQYDYKLLLLAVYPSYGQHVIAGESG